MTRATLVATSATPAATSTLRRMADGDRGGDGSEPSSATACRDADASSTIGTRVVERIVILSGATVIAGDAGSSTVTSTGDARLVPGGSAGPALPARSADGGASAGSARSATAMGG